MAKKMLIDATHAEETRVVVLDGTQVDEFDFETVNKRQLAGNIYLAKVTRVEPSLQAAFIDYGGNRHGFLAFAEIHPDYYQIPAEDRRALLEEERAAAVAAEAEEDARERRSSRGERGDRSERSERGDRRDRRERRGNRAEAAGTRDAVVSSDAIPGMEVLDNAAEDDQTTGTADGGVADPADTEGRGALDLPVGDNTSATADGPADTEGRTALDLPEGDLHDSDAEDEGHDPQSDDDDDEEDSDEDEPETIESVSEDVAEVVAPRKPRARRYKIQEVIKVRQIMLVQVVKEERGNKGAALTTYLSLAGRYCVLMPNTARGGGISRKITNAPDRKKLKEIASELEVPQGAGLIIRTAGSQRTKVEIRRDYEYLMRLWEQIRELTFRSIAPAPIYEEGDLIKRTIRDLYSKEIDEVLVEGERGYQTARDFMTMIMPDQVRQVKHYTDPMPLFSRHQVESYLGGMFNPVVQLKSGGYIVIGITEALVAIDVNSGRATKEGSIEDTAYKTNCEAADEIARQLRLRDLAGLIVIDFIDMDERRNNASVEKRFKDRLKNDRARIQVGRISGFGLLEMSRQRLRPGMLESTTQPCAHCHGTGLIRSDDSMALQILRAIEEEGTRKRSREVLVKAPIGVANFLINQKREHIAVIEARTGMSVRIEADPTLVSPDWSMEKFKTATRLVEPTRAALSVDASLMAAIDEAREGDVVEVEAVEIDGDVDEALSVDQVEAVEADRDTGDADDDGEGNGRRRRRRRRRGGKGRDEAADASAEGGEAEADADAVAADEHTTDEQVTDASAEAEVETGRGPRRRRRRRGSDELRGETEADAVPAEAEAAAGHPSHEDVAEPTPVEADLSHRVPAGPVVAETDEGVAADRTEPAEPELAETPDLAPQDDPAPVIPEEEAEPELQQEPEPVAAEVEPQPAAEPRPRRRGWWSFGA